MFILYSVLLAVLLLFGGYVFNIDRLDLYFVDAVLVTIVGFLWWRRIDWLLDKINF